MANISKKPFAKPRQLEPRGRPGKQRPVLSGATADDPLVPVQILKVRQSVWEELARAAAERKWHRSVLIRELLDEWVAERKRAAKTEKTKPQAGIFA